jgi:hypothetical protein
MHTPHHFGMNQRTFKHSQKLKHLHKHQDKVIHLVTIPSTQIKLPKYLEVRLLGVTCLFPKLPSNATKKSSLSLAYSCATVNTYSFRAFWKADCSSKALLRRDFALAGFLRRKSFTFTFRRRDLSATISLTNCEYFP